MSGPLVSTITPCYRMKPYLQSFLELLPRQTIFDRLEVVLDHNEPDAEELAWVRAFQERHPGRLKHVIVPQVEPIGVSMNRCIREASGELLAIWNVDDLRTDNSLAAQAAALAAAPAAGFAFGPFRIVREFGATAGELIDNRALPASELTRGMIIGPFFMFRKSLGARAGVFDEQLRSGADFDLAVRLACHAGAVTTPTELGYYLNAGLGASTRPGSLQPLERTVIELRYGIYDKIDWELVPAAVRYDVAHLVIDGARRPVGEFVADYERLLDERRRQWFVPGMHRHYWRRHVVGRALRTIAAAVRLNRRNGTA